MLYDEDESPWSVGGDHYVEARWPEDGHVVWSEKVSASLFAHLRTETRVKEEMDSPAKTGRVEATLLYTTFPLASTTISCRAVVEGSKMKQPWNTWIIRTKSNFCPNKSSFKTNGWVFVLFAREHQGDFSQTGG